MLARFDPTFVYANYFEAALWIVVAVIAWTRRSPRAPRAGAVLAIFLVLFGISDLVETRTGGWYKPWWMLTWKALCIAMILASGVTIYRAARRAS